MARVNNIAKAFAQAGLNTNRLSMSTLVLQQPIIAGNSTYEFPVLQNEAPVLPDEIRLALQDTFVVTAMAVCFSGIVSFAGPPAVTNRDYFFAPPVQAAAAAIPLYSLYRGRLSYKMNEVVYIQNWDVQRHYMKGQAQLLGVSGVNGITHAFDEREGSKSGFFPVEPGVMLNGNSKMSFIINMPDNLLVPAPVIPFTNGAAEALNVNIDRITILLRGYLGQNSSTVNNIQK